ncbi:hypothetical protein FIBSPDRAFT_877791 [Athelia psychrophila]|uniref:Uncharacterized protein n=1 Tax=Athelia psychrophila TaxID=1759441 RepID=A0A167VND5_9AGAM|nr:hypothetical protein FIBSPDRAFT_877791 [Fibularhizoctonia sp. CBS 109695]
MTRGKPCLDDLREVIISLARHLDIDSIVRCTEGALLLAEYRHKGLIGRRRTAKDLRGAKRSITAVDV